MSKDAFRGTLERVDACCWRIPKSYKPGMQVDGLIFASDKLMQQLVLDQAPEQVANVACLPGIQVASLAMPDIHWGYGFCIGGVAATDPAQGGVVSPGGVGYDINCLTGEALVLHRHGYTRRIDEMAGDWPRADLAVFDLAASTRTAARPALWFGKPPSRPVLELTSRAGDRVRATADHPFWTPHGMLPLDTLRPGDRIGVHPFEGVPYEAPAEAVLVSEADLREKARQLGRSESGHAIEQAIAYLHRRGLLPLTTTSAALPVLLKLLGFVFGDGSLHFEAATGKGVVSLTADEDDLEAIRADLASIGVTASRVYSRERQHAIRTTYAAYRFDRREHAVRVRSSAVSLLLVCLGAPVGKKTSQAAPLPAWLDVAPLWQKRLFLAGLFGAELTRPATVPGRGKTFAAPVLSLNKRPAFEAEGRRTLERLRTWLAEFGVQAQSIQRRDEQVNRDGERSVRLRLVLSSRTDSLLCLWGRVGYEYNRKRAGLAALAVQYLKHQRRARRERAEAARAIAATEGADRSPSRLTARLAGRGLNRRFVERALYSPATGSPRLPAGFPSFAAYCAEAGAGERPGGMVWEEVAAVVPVADHAGPVYDFTVDHPDHNFVANGFVVSNCGVRLVRSNLSYREVKPHLRTLIDELFKSVPTGVGRSGKYKFDHRELQHLMGQGTNYLVGRGLASQTDIEHTEAHGQLLGADPSLVSDHAMDRGAQQCGTLGSGNHFLEVQVVDHIFDEDAARVMGLEKDMICVMIHSGSRGLGYQVCDDALASLRKAPEKYGIELPDRQLACAPADSPEGRRYIGAMRAAANFAWCNRQLLMMQAREVFARVFGRSWEELHMGLIYDVCHNIAKLEEHTVGGKTKQVWVHRKGATRAFPPGHPEVPSMYQGIGQPVIIPGDMGRASWVLVGQPGSMERTFGTTCHGAGRVLSRTAAIRATGTRRIDKELEAKGVIARAQSRKGLAEEQPGAYKNVDDVVEVVDSAGLSKKVARMRPIGVIKG